MTPPSSTLWPKLLLALGMTLAFLLLLEAAGRWLFPLPQVGWDGEAKPADRIRLLVAGGSTVYGHPVPAFGFAAQLEAALDRAAPDKQVEVINLGANGRGSGFALRSLRANLAAEPDAVVIMTGHNEYLDRSGERSAHPALHDALRRLGISRLLHEALHSARKRMGGLHAMPDRQIPYERTRPWFTYVQRRYASHLAEMAERCRRAGVPVVFCTLPSNLADWPPVHRGLEGRGPGSSDAAAVDALLDRIAEDPGAVGEEVARRMKQDPDDAMLWFLRGRVDAVLHRPSDAQAAFVRARDLDPFPWRAGTALNDAVRDVGGRPATLLVDVERRLMDHARPGPGLDWISDNVHPTPVGNALIARWLAEVLAARIDGMDPARLDDVPPEAQWQEYRAGLPAEQVGELEFTWMLETGVYCMKHPYHALELAEHYLNQAEARQPDHWRVCANLGVLRLLQGQPEEGVALLRRAASLRGAGLRLDEAAATPYLGEAVRRAGVEQALTEEGVLLR